jgi:hypothetical protein
MRHSLRQVDAVGADPGGEPRVGADQQLQAAGAGDRLQPHGLRLGGRRAERAEDDRGAARQGAGDGLEVGRSRRVGEEQQGRQALPRAGGAI